MKKIVLLLLLLLLFSCEKEKTIDLKLDNFEEKMVVQGFLSAQNNIELVVKKTVSPDVVNVSDKLDNLLVMLSDNQGGQVQLISNDDKHFFLPSNVVLNPAYKYNIEATSTKYDAKSEFVSIISAIPIDSIIKETGSNYDDDKMIIYYNNPDINNIYLAKFYFYKNGNLINDYPQTEKFDPYDMIMPDNIGSNSYKVRAYRNIDSVKVKFYTLSKELAKYYKSYINYTNSLQSSFGESYPIYSNISGGLGVFGSYAYDEKVWRGN